MDVVDRAKIRRKVYEKIKLLPYEQWKTISDDPPQYELRLENGVYILLGLTKGEYESRSGIRKTYFFDVVIKGLETTIKDSVWPTVDKEEFSKKLVLSCAWKSNCGEPFGPCDPYGVYDALHELYDLFRGIYNHRSNIAEEQIIRRRNAEVQEEKKKLEDLIRILK